MNAFTGLPRIGECAHGFVARRVCENAPLRHQGNTRRKVAAEAGTGNACGEGSFINHCAKSLKKYAYSVCRAFKYVKQEWLSTGKSFQRPVKSTYARSYTQYPQKNEVSGITIREKKSKICFVKNR